MEVAKISKQQNTGSKIIMGKLVKCSIKFEKKQFDNTDINIRIRKTVAKSSKNANIS